MARTTRLDARIGSNWVFAINIHPLLIADLQKLISGSTARQLAPNKTSAMQLRTRSPQLFAHESMSLMMA